MPKTLPTLAAALLAGASLAACERNAGDAMNETVAAAPTRTAALADSAQLPQSAAAAPVSSDTLSREVLSDAAITARLKAQLLTDPALTGADVSVNTDGGVVVLTGTVKSQEQAAIASAHAQRHDGVMRIDNHLSTLPQ